MAVILIFGCFLSQQSSNERVVNKLKKSGYELSSIKVVKKYEYDYFSSLELQKNEIDKLLIENIDQMVLKKEGNNVKYTIEIIEFKEAKNCDFFLTNYFSKNQEFFKQPYYYESQKNKFYILYVTKEADRKYLQDFVDSFRL